jgi:hypothetical protein
VNEWGDACVRTANYYLAEGTWGWPAGFAETRNFRSTYDFRGGFEGWEELTTPVAPLRLGDIRGLEDVRLCGQRFTATQQQWSSREGHNEIVVGTWPDLRFVVVPTDRDCEKNWLPLCDGSFIYQFAPFLRGRLTDAGELALEAEDSSSPPWHGWLRGSAPPFRVADRWLALAHLVTSGFPRRYLSVLVELEGPAGRPSSWSSPFYFLERGIEYCLSAVAVGDEVHFFVSRLDRETYVVRTPIPTLLRLLEGP